MSGDNFAVKDAVSQLPSLSDSSNPWERREAWVSDWINLISSLSQATDRKLFEVEGKVFSLSDKKVVSDANGQKLYSLHKKHLTLHSRIEGEGPNGDVLFSVKKSLISIGSKFEIEFANKAGNGAQVTWTVKGDLFDRKATSELRVLTILFSLLRSNLLISSSASPTQSLLKMERLLLLSLVLSPTWVKCSLTNKGEFVLLFEAESSHSCLRPAADPRSWPQYEFISNYLYSYVVAVAGNADASLLLAVSEETSQSRLPAVLWVLPVLSPLLTFPFLSLVFPFI